MKPKGVAARWTEAAHRTEGPGPNEATSPGDYATQSGGSLEQIVEELSTYLRGWRGETPTTLRDADGWIRRRLRSLIWKLWRHSSKRFAELRQRGAGRELAQQTVGSSHGPWRPSNSPALVIAIGNDFLKSLGLAYLYEVKTT